MIWLAEYLKMMSCNHDFMYSEGQAEESFSDGTSKSGLKYCMICKKCGFTKKGWKFLK